VLLYGLRACFILLLRVCLFDCSEPRLQFAQLDGLSDLADDGVLIPEEAAPQFLDDCAPCNGMMPPPDSEMISPPITE
jgi:hypothetical protein